MPELNVVAVIIAKPGSEDAVSAALNSVVEPTRAEAGCIAYDLFVSTLDATTFVTVEKWRSQEDLDAHLASPHIQGALGSAGALLAGPPQIMPLAGV